MGTGIFVFALGAYFAFQGFTAEYFVDESHSAASDEQKKKWKATPLLRVVFVCFGFGMIIWGILRIAGRL
ncbi:MAG TPA: hypothetical protein VN612_17950 [Acidobacteriaceae bacterium]|nr:hypothetical protein [Acidobacteriaceae bacterium]